MWPQALLFSKSSPDKSQRPGNAGHLPSPPRSPSEPPGHSAITHEAPPPPSGSRLPQLPISTHLPPFSSQTLAPRSTHHPPSSPAPPKSLTTLPTTPQAPWPSRSSTRPPSCSRTKAQTPIATESKPHDFLPPQLYLFLQAQSPISGHLDSPKPYAMPLLGPFSTSPASPLPPALTP